MTADILIEKVHGRFGDRILKTEKRSAKRVYVDIYPKDIVDITREDCIYSPWANEVQYKRGLWGESQLETWLKSKSLTYRTEKDLRGEFPKTPDCLLDERELIVLVVDGKLARKPQVGRLAAKKACTDGMERAERQFLRHAGAEQFLQPLAHFTRGLVGECDGHDVARRDVPHPNEIRRAMRQHARLAGAGPGQHQHRAIRGLNCLSLLGIQVGEKIH